MRAALKEVENNKEKETGREKIKKKIKEKVEKSFPVNPGPHWPSAPNQPFGRSRSPTAFPPHRPSFLFLTQ